MPVDFQIFLACIVCSIIMVGIPHWLINRAEKRRKRAEELVAKAEQRHQELMKQFAEMKEARISISRLSGEGCSIVSRIPRTTERFQL